MRTFWFGVITTVAMFVAGCSTVAPPPAAPPERLAFTGTLDLTGTGIGFLLSHVSSLSCSGRYPSSRLPETVPVAITCNDELEGVLNLTKAGRRLTGGVVLSDAREGDVVFELPLTRVAAPVPTTVPSPVRTHTATVAHRGRGGCGSRGGPGYRTSSGKCASWKHRRRR